MQQFFALLTVYLFCKGFVTEQSQGYRYLTTLAFLAAVLSQEISAVMAFPLAMGYILFSKDLGWRANLKLAALVAWAIGMIVLDYAVFQTRCLTRVEGVSPNLEDAVKPHFWQPYNFFSLFIGYSRLHLLLSFFLFAGLPLAWRERRRNTLAFHFILFAGVALTNLLVTHVSVRYQFWLFPIWVLLSLDSIRSVISWLSTWMYEENQHRNRHMVIVGISTAVIFVSVVLSWSPWRIPGSYDLKILGDSTGAFRYVRTELRDGDRIAATEPHTHAGLLEAGQIDFDVSIPLLYDFSVLKDGRLIDRNGGATVVASLDEFQKVCRENDRVWVLLNREKFRTRGKNLRWEYPGARFESFLRKNCELKHRTYLWHVYLWDRANGLYIPFRQHGA